MKVLLRATEEPESRILALHPESGEPVTRIEPFVWADSSDQSTAYEHPEGIWWWEDPTENLEAKGHEVEWDD